MGKLKVINTRGFTLVETLVAIAVIAVLGLVMADLLTRTLRTGSKTELIGTIKNNGVKALNIMENTVQFSDRVICVGQYNSAKDTIVLYKGGYFTRFRFLPSVSGKNGYIQEDSPTLSDITQFNTLCTLGTYTNPVVLTDTDQVTGVSVQSGSFTLVQSPGYKDQVTINFSLLPGAQAAAGWQNQVSSAVNFSTTVVLR